MKQIISLFAIIGLGLTVVPSVFVLTGTLSSDMNKTLMLIGTLIWFVAAPFWFRKAREERN